MSVDPVVIAASSTDPSINVWSLNSGALLRSIKENSSGKGCLAARAVKGSLLILASQGTTGVINVWKNGAAAQPTQKFITGLCVTAIALSRDGRALAAGTSDGSLHIWDLDSGLLCFSQAACHYAPVTTISFDCPSVVVSASSDGAVNCWWLDSIAVPNVDGSAILPLCYWIDHTDCVSSVFVNPSGTVVTCGRDGFAFVYTLGLADRILSISFPNCSLSFALINTIESRIAIASDCKIYLLSINEFKSCESANALVVSSDQSYTNILNWHKQAISALAWSPDETFLVAGCDGGSVSVWDSESGQLIRNFSGVAPVERITSLASMFLPSDHFRCKQKGCSETAMLPMLQRSVSREILVKLKGKTVRDRVSSQGKFIPDSSGLSVKYEALEAEHARLSALYDELYQLTLSKVKLD